ncbi:glycoside hydrolase family 5 protein [Oscillochloris sp. ZM17-4]|uniref:glycoside hydrolase family 5 protein n=1 Tax=Oscillochloris sp. ZM17-4 TaxID=2866714 RepID=UPI001C72F536|nr:glycoside hydrolase family 5 protein [Oscillochloris sp. ZM17-4]MBX0327806.1 glycoside hydrolase family 5 protein [Oscillochloris sp. ZM17-4]
MKRLTLLSILTLLTLLALLIPSSPASGAARQPGLPPSLFGLNMYLTGRERGDAEATALLGMATQIGARWSREEISWAAWGPSEDNRFYDRRLGQIADAGVGIIGMLLTTPKQYRDPACVRYAKDTNQPEYWCAPTDMAAYARWAAGVVERYDGDGYKDAPGSPRVAAWEIWNEPDLDGTWLPRADAGAYAQMLRLAHDAIKAADPTATVLNGGVYTFDAVGQSGFMDRVVDLAGWDSFDVISIHPWLIDHAPDDPSLINPRERFDVTIPGRIELVKRWAAARGGGKPIWISEMGWSTCGGSCAPQFAKSEQEQADYMVRSFVLAAAAGVEHVSYFQLEDKFGGGQQPWGPAAIVRDDLSPKPAYIAYGAMVAQLQFARYRGTGPLHRPGSLADYRFDLGDGSTVDVLWSLGAPASASFPLTAGLSAALIDRDGGEGALAGRAASLSLSGRPIYVRQLSGRSRSFGETGQSLRDPFLGYWERGGGLAIFGFPISAERVEQGADGGSYRVQWFERNRFELHPENRPPYNVQLGLLGVESLARRGIDWRGLPTVGGPPSGQCRYFPETGHSLCPPFRAYWERSGGLAVFGFPISEPFDEDLGGGARRVQYFERNRFEEHPEQPAAYRVQLGRLGAELMP